MKITSEHVSSALKHMREYERNHFGMPNGDDFQDLAKAIADCDEVCIVILMNVLMIGISGGKELAELIEGNKITNSKHGLAMAVAASSSFRQYADLIYLGYLLGKEMAEIESLERSNYIK